MTLNFEISRDDCTCKLQNKCRNPAFVKAKHFLQQSVTTYEGPQISFSARGRGGEYKVLKYMFVHLGTCFASRCTLTNTKTNSVLIRKKSLRKVQINIFPAKLFHLNFPAKLFHLNSYSLTH